MKGYIPVLDTADSSRAPQYLLSLALILLDLVVSVVAFIGGLVLIPFYFLHVWTAKLFQHLTNKTEGLILMGPTDAVFCLGKGASVTSKRIVDNEHCIDRVFMLFGGPAPSLSDLQERISKRILNVKRHGRYVHWKLRHVPIYQSGLFWWRPTQKFNVADHVRLYPSGKTFENTKDIGQLFVSRDANFSHNPQWAINLVHSKDGTQWGLYLVYSHGITDGNGLFTVFLQNLDDSMRFRDSKFIPYPGKYGMSLMLIRSLLTFPRMIRALVPRGWTSRWLTTKKNGKRNFVTSDSVFTTSQLKIKQGNTTYSVTETVTAATIQALRKTFPKECENEHYKVALLTSVGGENGQLTNNLCFGTAEASDSDAEKDLLARIRLDFHNNIVDSFFVQTMRSVLGNCINAFHPIAGNFMLSVAQPAWAAALTSYNVGEEFSVFDQPLLKWHNCSPIPEAFNFGLIVHAAGYKGEIMIETICDDGIMNNGQLQRFNNHLSDYLEMNANKRGA